MARQQGQDFVRAIVIYFITDLCTFFNPTRNMNAKQISDTADIMLLNFLPLEYRATDFSLMFLNIKSLKYGEFYEGIDGGKLMKMAWMYDRDRDAEIEEFQKVNAAKFKEEAKAILENTDARVLKSLKDLAEKASIIKRTEEQVTERKKSHVQIMIEGWYAEFDKLHSEQKQPIDEAPRMVVYNGKARTASEFVEVKFDEYNDKI